VAQLGVAAAFSFAYLDLHAGVGASGTVAAGVTATETTDAALVPRAWVAVTVKGRVGALRGGKFVIELFHFIKPPCRQAVIPVYL
jgi:hypothetical protein